MDTTRFFKVMIKTQNHESMALLFVLLYCFGIYMTRPWGFNVVKGSMIFGLLMTQMETKW